MSSLLANYAAQADAGDGPDRSRTFFVPGFHSTRWAVRLGAAVALICLAVIGVVSYRGIGDVKTDAEVMDRMEDGMDQLDALASTVADMEKGQRIFVLTGNESYLGQFRQEQAGIENEVRELQNSLVDDSREGERFRSLVALLGKQRGIYQKIVALRGEKGAETAYRELEEGEGKEIYEQLAGLIAEIKSREEGRWDTQERHSQQSVFATKAVVVFGSLFALVVSAFGLYFIERDFAGRARAEAALRKVNEALEGRVRLRTAELADAHEFARESEARLSAIVRSSSDAIISKSLAGIITSWNSGAEKIFGYTEQEALGQPILMLFPPERMHEEADILARIARDDAVTHFETQRVRKDGRRIDISVTISPVHDSEGRVIGASKIARDITGQKRAQASLLEREEQLRLYAEHSPMAVAMVDREMKYLVVSRRWREDFRLGEQALVGRSHYEVFPEIPAHWKEVHRRCLAGAVEKCDEEAFPRADGTVDWLRWEVHPWRRADGAIGGIIMFGEDISARKRAEEANRKLNAELEQRVVERTAQFDAANKELEAFSYSVSHDLRAPLRAMDGFSQALLEDYGPQLPAEAQEHIQTIRASVGRMSSLIDDLLTFSRLSRSPLHRRRVDISQLVRATLEDLAAQRRGREIEIRRLELPVCEGDPVLLKQVWINLLSNALKYTQKCARAVVEIGSMEKDGETVYFVRDNGIGFDMRYAGKLFGVFQRLHRAEDYEGTGVGLAIVQRVIQRHGGQVWAEAKHNEGATFFFTLAKGGAT